MAKKITAALCLVLTVLFLAASFPVFSETTLDETDSLIKGILSNKMGEAKVTTLQAFADTFLCEKAGIRAEWLVWGLCRYDKSLDLSSYADALEAYLTQNKVTSASSRQKYALALVAADRENAPFVMATLADSVGAQGIMSYVYGLHLLNNGLPVTGHTVESVVETLLSFRLADGGWALTGMNSDVDVTAMTLQALAPHYGKSEVKAACDEALACLSAKQLADGDFASYGTPNPESTAQVLMALSSLGIDPRKDERFIKNDKTLLDGIVKYRLEDGSYSHTAGGESNHTATVQSFCAFVSLSLLEKGEKSFYLYEGVDYAPEKVPETLPEDPSDDFPNERNEEGEGNPYLWKLLMILGILLAAGIVMVIFHLKGRKGKDRLLVLISAVVLILAVSLIRVESRDSFYSPDEVEDPVGSVSFTIRCDTVAGVGSLPDDGVILTEGDYPFAEGDSVYDILLRAAKKEGLHVETSGSSVYVYGIENLYEFDHGELSGWVYTVNGEKPSLGCDSYTVKDGDRVAFHYTLSLGNDIPEES